MVCFKFYIYDAHFIIFIPSSLKISIAFNFESQILMEESSFHSQKGKEITMPNVNLEDV